MLELGSSNRPDLHAALADDIVAANDFDLVLAAGPMMRSLAIALQGRFTSIEWRPLPADLQPAVLDAVRAGDVVVVKGLERQSHGADRRRAEAPLRARHFDAAPALA